MNVQGKTYDLTDCDREPIHQLGNIQDFGAMVAVNADWMVAHYSENFSDVLHCGDNPEVGIKLSEYFNSQGVEALRKAISQIAADDAVERLFGVPLCDEGSLYDVAVHVTGHLTIIEFEPHVGADFGNEVAKLRPLLNELDPIEDVEKLCECGAAMVKQLLGFDRVMVYRFHPDQSGEVVAEATEPGIGSFLGLRYPRTDIPDQARQLYLRNRFRIISNVRSEPVPIVPAQSLMGEPVDLSLSTLRAVSPIHLEYLRNMGVDASLSISIIQGGKLWGLFACHNYSPRVLPFSLRTVAELFSQMFSLMLDRALISARDRLQGDARKIHDQLMARLAGGTSLIDSLPTLDKVLGEIIPHHGSSIYVEGLYRSRGDAPSEEQFLALVQGLNSAATSRVIATNSLSEQFPSATDFADRAVGALVIPISRRPRDYLVLWRRELKQIVTWAGNPEKTMTAGPNGDRLSPRESFAAWQESVDGRSSEWLDEEQQVAESLRVTLLEVILRLTDDAVQERARAQEQQELLIAELNHRVRNILNLIRSLISQSRHEAMEVEEFSKLIGGRIGALASAHDNITKQNWSPAKLSSLFETEAEAYLQGKRDRLTIIGDDVLIAPEAYTVLALVIHEMMTNSVKYGSFCDSRGTLEITLDRLPDQDLRFHWKERGGPPVQAPTRRGFGSTIIERSIPFELKGEAKIEYKLAGVEACFVVPSRYVSAIKETSGNSDGDGNRKSGEAGKGAALKLTGLPEHVLIVEDSMIIAMDTEESLRSLGVTSIDIAGSVNGALDAISKHVPQFAIVDFNLGAESSEPVAKELKGRGIPFVLASGYGELSEQLEEYGANRLIRKPYGIEEIREALTELH